MNHERLVPLHTLPDFDVADGYTDIRGFDAFLTDGRRVGRVNELLVDPEARRVAAITLDGESGMRAASQVPIEAVEIDTPSRRVLIQGGGAPGLAAASTASATGAEALRDDDATLMHPAVRPEGGEQRMMLAEEELALYKNRVEAGSVDVHKRVETRHVRESVPVMHEEVTVERRRVDNPDASTEVRYEGDTMIVPIVEEELVVQKRTVVREELVIRRKRVEREQVVEADLRRERVDVDGPGISDGGGMRAEGDAAGAMRAEGGDGGTMRADGASALDRAAQWTDQERDLPRGDGPESTGGGPDGIRVR